MDSQFYAYLHARPTTCTAAGIFYVGKGSGGRGNDLFRVNQHHRNIVAKHGAKNILVGKLECSSEDVAFELEKGLIKCLRRMQVTLCNRTSGGEGVPGYTRTAEWREQHSQTMKGRPSPLRGTALSAEHKLRIAATLKLKSPWTGKAHTLEARAKMGTTLGTKLVSKNGQVLRIPVEAVAAYAAQGWVLGKSPMSAASKKSIVGEARWGRLYITNGVETKCIRAPMLPPNGWRFGATRNKGKG